MIGIPWPDYFIQHIVTLTYIEGLYKVELQQRAHSLRLAGAKQRSCCSGSAGHACENQKRL